jgi:serine/threonine protein kinase
MMLSDCSALTESLSGHHLLEDAALSETVRDLVPRFDDPKQLADELVRRGWLTAYQKEIVLAGRAEELILGAYVLLEKIGEGGMGAVYKARHRVLKAVRAIKVIRPDRLAGKGAVQRFYREAEVVAKLHHPNIILAHDAGEHSGVHYFVMEYAPGADLGQLLQRCGPLPAVDACTYIRQAAHGLEHARERGLVHRDIKPSNVLISPAGDVKLLDLGLARACAAEEEEEPGSVPLTQDGAVMGTPDYMAPEQAENSRRVDIRADIYSLGCTLYHILTGRPPYPGGSVMEKLIKHRLEQPRPIEALRGDLPQGLGDVVRKMMAKAADQRYQTPAEVAAALTPFCGHGRPIPTQPAELAGTLLPEDVVGLSAGLSAGLAGVATVDPGEALHLTSTGLEAEDAPTATSPALLRGSTERLSRPPDGLQATQLPLGGELTRMPRGERTGLQATELLTEGDTNGGQTEPLVAPPPRRAALVAAALALIGLGAAGAGAYIFATRSSPTQPGVEQRRVDGPADKPTTVAAANNNVSPVPGEGGPVEKKEPKEDLPGATPKPPVADTLPAGPPPKAVAKGLTGDRTDLVSVRSRGPAVRTGGRGLSWARRRELYALNPHKGQRAAFSADGSRAVFGTSTDALLVYYLREIQPGFTTSLPELTGNLTDTMASHIGAVGLSPDSNKVLLTTVGRSERPLDGYPVTTRFNMLVTWELNGATDLIYGPRIENRANFNCVAFSPDGKEVLVGGTLPQIYRWKAGSRDLRANRGYFKHGTGDVVTALTYSADGRLAASAGQDRLVCVYDATKSGSEPLSTLSGMRTPVQSVALSPSGRYVLAGGRDGKACLWDTGDEPPAKMDKPTHVFEWHDKESTVKAVTFAPNGRFFLTGSDDGTICLGEFGKDKPVWTEPSRGGGPILALAVAADGRNVLVADETGLGQYPLVQDVNALAKAGVTAGAEIAPAEAKGP